jgi:hypothetical protein
MNLPIARYAKRASGARRSARDAGPTFARSCCCWTTPIGFDEKPGRSSKRAISGERESWPKKLRPSAPPRRDGSCGSSVRGCCPAPKSIESGVAVIPGAVAIAIGWGTDLLTESSVVSAAKGKEHLIGAFHPEKPAVLRANGDDAHRQRSHDSSGIQKRILASAIPPRSEHRAADYKQLDC